MALIKYQFLYRSDSNDVLISTNDGQWSAIVSPLNELSITNDVLNIPISATSFINLHFLDVDTINGQTPTSLGLIDIVSLTQYLNATCFNDIQPISGGTISGVSGSGFIGFTAQNITPSTPTSGFKLYANSTNALSWIGANGFTRTFDGTANTNNRTYTLPDNDGTIALLSDISGGGGGGTVLNGYGFVKSTGGVITYVTGSSSQFVKANGTLDSNTYLTGIDSTQVTTALGYTPYNATNPNGYITNSALSPYLTITSASSIYQPIGNYLTSISGSQVITALGYTPYNSSNPNGYITSSSLNNFLPILGGTISGVSGSGFIGFTAQNITPSTPTSGFKLYANNSNALSWIGANGFTRTFDGTTNTANRTYTLPNTDGVIALISDISLKQNILSGSGFVKSNSGVISYDTSTYLTGITSSQVTTALGYTPYDVTNPSGYITNSALTGYGLLSATQSWTGTNTFTSPLKITAGGDLIIGTTTALSENNGAIYIKANTGGFFFQRTNGGTNLVNIKDNGNLLIGTTTDAGFKLDVNGKGRFAGLQVNGSQAGTLLSVSTPTTLGEQRFIIVTASVVITLPTASSCNGRTYTINARSAEVTISSYTNLAGTSGQTTITNGTSITLISDGTNWQQVA